MRRSSQTENVSKLAFLVNGAYVSPMGYRARSFARHLANSHDIHIAYRSKNKPVSTLNFLRFLFLRRPVLTYVFDMAYAGVLAAALYKVVSRNHVIIDTGDSISDLARSLGDRGRVGLWLTDALQHISFACADCIIVRGSYHRELLRDRNIRVEVIHDGVDVEQFVPHDASELRRQLGLDDVLTIGVVGSSIWNEKLQICYGWDLVETIRLLKDKPVKGILIGDGSGIVRLKTLCRRYGIEDKVLFLGFRPYEDLPLYLSIIDICLSTQTNDVVGKVRTTGKLPLYLASGRYILASKVGEAALVLDDQMLVEYDGVKDAGYPFKLAQRINRLLEQNISFRPLPRNIAVARDRFDYSVLSKRVKTLIDSIISA